jgi:hypothetical protein
LSTAAELEEFSGEGHATVLNDGQIVLEFTDPAKDAAALVLTEADEQFLISDGTKSTILPPGEDVPEGTRTKVSLTYSDPSCGGVCAIGRFEGSISITKTSGDNWEVHVSDHGTTIFEYGFEDTGEASGSSGCSAQCPGGNCSCSPSVVCICFCGLFHEPWCIGIIPLRQAVSHLISV